MRNASLQLENANEPSPNNYEKLSDVQKSVSVSLVDSTSPSNVCKIIQSTEILEDYLKSRQGIMRFERRHMMEASTRAWMWIDRDVSMWVNKYIKEGKPLEMVQRSIWLSSIVDRVEVGLIGRFQKLVFDPNINNALQVISPKRFEYVNPQRSRLFILPADMDIMVEEVSNLTCDILTAWIGFPRL
ncbi:hypothetical protein FA15DRAFT_704648 [Coprinopsis marcescibilis]|uniref:Uncharacterized protein n=1 Tax=Coprinopsis marcescibilis TaxID=230819 RepID=A0A5C3L7T0_COPMA|nr:hypothetical protein FA15DRAFT_704648 [Coprinopsis marcescibilis]